MSEVYTCVCVCVCCEWGGGVYSSAFIMLLHHLYISYTHCKYVTPCHIPYSQLCKGAPSTSCVCFTGVPNLSFLIFAVMSCTFISFKFYYV